jgi:hypothetical protein
MRIGILKMKAEKKEIGNGILLPATSGFTRLRHYPRLKIFTIFAASCSLGSVLEAATS